MENICIVGLGLIGGSYAKALKRAGYRILGIDHNPAILLKAQQDGTVDQGSQDARTLLPGADTVVVCLYPRDIGPFIRKHQRYMEKDTLVTDVASVKRTIYQDLEGLREDIDFIGGHPMGGSQEKGYDHSRWDLFRGCNYLITVTERNQPRNILRVETLARALHVKQVIQTTPEHHDRMIARTSHLPHILAMCLKETIREEDAEQYSGRSFQEMTRVADLNEELWDQIFQDNREYLLEAVREFQQLLEEKRNGLKGKPIGSGITE